jgi:hypothetical protein
MNKWDKLLDRILRVTSDASIPFDDPCSLLERLGFERRTRGRHNIFRRSGVIEKPNLQRSGKHAKVYQVRQVRDMILRYRLGEEL